MKTFAYLCLGGRNQRKALNTSIFNLLKLDGTLCRIKLIPPKGFPVKSFSSSDFGKLSFPERR